MSQLNSLFDVLAGLSPHGKSALEYNFEPVIGETPVLIEGMVGKVTRLITFPMAAGGYTPCIVTDIGKVVTGTGTTNTGKLISYDNTALTWTIQPTTWSDDFIGETAFTIGGGTGAGTIDGTLPVVHTQAKLTKLTSANVAAAPD